MALGMSAFSDLSEELDAGKRCFDHIYAKDVPESVQAMTDWCSWNIEWFCEPMPLERTNGADFEREVRQMIGECCYRDDVPPIAEVDPPREEDILVFPDLGGFCHKLLDRAPDGRVGSRKFVSKRTAELTESDFEALLASKVWDLVIVGFALDPPKSSSVQDILDHQSDAARAIFSLLKVAYLKEGRVRRMAVLTHDIFSEVQETHRQRGLEITTGGIMYGMCNTARMECEFPIQFVDVELTDCYELVPHVSSELFRLSTFGVNTVRHCYPYALRKGIRTERPCGRYVVRQVSTHNYQTAGVQFEIPEEGVIAISGGNGALGLVMGLWLLDFAVKRKAASSGSYNPRFSIQFLSRSAKVSDQNMENWAKL